MIKKGDRLLMKANFKLGVLAGIAGSVVTAAAAAFGYRQKVVKPQKQAEETYEEVTKVANRKSVSAHQSRY
jgi:hypothetical protein